MFIGADAWVSRELEILAKRRAAADLDLGGVFEERPQQVTLT